MFTKRIGLKLLLSILFTVSVFAVIDTGSASADLDSRDYTLEVVSAKGSPDPAAGTHTYPWGSTITCSAGTEAGYTCTGWSGTGSIPENGAADSTGEIALNELTSTMTWLWEVDIQYHTVTLRPGTHGSIAEANSGVDYVVQVDDGAAFPAVTVVPDTGYTFTGWQPALPDTITADFEATAQYSIQTFTVTFIEGTNSIITAGDAVQTVAYGGSAAAPDVEADEGYYFIGWDVSFDNVTSDITVTAVTRERFNGKDGINEPLEILIAEELVYISENSEYWSLDAALKGNIDLGGRFLLPIGNIEQPFNAEFNGCGYVISNLQLAFCYSPAQGLFGIVGTNGIVKNLGVDANILAARYFNFDSGIIAGQNQGVIRCCWTSGNVAGYITAGGVAGYNVGIISNSYSMAGCSAYFAGGLVGENGGTISNCYTSTTIVSIDNRTIEGCRILEPATPYILETFGWDTVNNNEDGRMDYWFQEENRLPLLFWQALRGDVNYDGTADMQDLMILADWWLLSDDALDEDIRLRGDINFDGRVDMLDFVELIKAMVIIN